MRLPGPAGTDLPATGRLQPTRSPRIEDQRSQTCRLAPSGAWTTLGWALDATITGSYKVSRGRGVPFGSLRLAES